MKYKDLSIILRKEFSPAISGHGFQEIGATCMYVRRTAEILHVAAVALSGHGPRFRVVLYFWVPEFVSAEAAKEGLASQLTRHCSREEYLGVFSTGSTKWWPCSSTAEAAESGRSLIAPFVRGALPWFQAVQSRADLDRVLIPDLPQFVAERLASGFRLGMPKAIEAMPIWTGLKPALDEGV